MAITAENFGELSFSQVLPAHLTKYAIAGAQPSLASGPFGHVLIQRLQANGFTLVHESYFLNRFATFFHTDGDPCLHLRLQVNNSMRCQIGQPQPILFHERGYNMVYMPTLQKRMHCRKEGMFNLMELHFQPELLQQLLPLFPVLEAFAGQVAQQRPALLVNVNQVATHKIMAITRDMLYSGYTGGILHTYLVAKARELLVTCLERIMNDPLREPIKLTEKEIERLYEARDIIIKNLAVEYTMQELCRMVGLTSYKLKIGFLELFGTTVAGYQRDVRMEKARELLQDETLSLPVIAAMVGFNHVNSFSMAYKNYYGISPAERMP